LSEKFKFGEIGGVGMVLEVMRGCNLGRRVEMMQEIGEEDACCLLEVPCGPMG
jgi:hypothetical protein